MEFGEALSSRLPSLRDDEPPGLRQDIIDELANHFALGVHRERLRGNDAATALARAVERFGDPAAVACRLWTDAMKGKFMAQRAVIVTCVLVAAASVISVGLLWQELVQARRMAVDQAAAQVAEARVREQHLLEQLRGISESIKKSHSPDRSLVQIKLAEELADGPPVDGATIELTCVSESPHKQFERKSSESGVAAFGPLEPGDYKFEITRSWADGSMSASGKLDVQPGVDVNKQIACPKVPPQRAGVCVRWQWPADLEKESLVLYATFRFRSVELPSGSRWGIVRNPVDQSGRVQFSDPVRKVFSCDLAHSILCGPSQTIARFKDGRALILWAVQPDYPDLSLSIERDVKLDRTFLAYALENEIEELSDKGAHG